MERFFLYFTSKRHVAGELLEQTDADSPVFSASRARVLAAGEPLLHAAQDAREIDAGLTLDQILDMIVAIAKIQNDSAYVQPILRAALAGLRQPSSR